LPTATTVALRKSATLDDLVAAPATTAASSAEPMTSTREGP
jgi:hypothetical protein